MTEPLDDARGELLALRDLLVRVRNRSLDAEHDIIEMFAALRATVPQSPDPACGNSSQASQRLNGDLQPGSGEPRCDAECATPVGIPNTDPARQFPLYELAPDFTLRDRDPQADERLKLYRDIFAEITAKAIAVTDPNSDDPERVRHYRLPVGPLHRAAGKLGFQLFNGENHLAEAVKEIGRLKAALSPDPGTVAVTSTDRETL